MPFYQSLGNIPKKRHTQFEQPDGSLYHEQLFGTIGFVGMSSLLYHLRRPTMVTRVEKSVNVAPTEAIENNLLSRKLE
jgi:homogentisate 1,2-dioxygenase